MSRIEICGACLVALLASTAASAQTVPPPGIISTHAQAHRRLPNTVSDVSVNIELHARDVPTTTSLLSKRSQSLLEYLRQQKVERLRTEQVGVDPETQEVRGQPDRITGYTGHETVSFRTTPELLPTLLAGCLDHGANSLQQSGSSPREEEVAKARQELAAQAAHEAFEQASIVAKAVGAKVVGIQQVNVDLGSDDAVRSAMAPKSVMRPTMPSAPIATEAGEAQVSVGVSISVRVASEN